MNLELETELKPLKESKEDSDVFTIQSNRKALSLVLKNWMLGPDKATENPKGNKDFWNKLAIAWTITIKEARRRNCGNCEYSENSPKDLEKMDIVPFNRLDADGGGRVFCDKFDFICHNLRVCQAWEEDKD